MLLHILRCGRHARRRRRADIRRRVIHDTGKVEAVDQHLALTVNGVGRLDAEAACLQAIRMLGVEAPLRQRVDGTSGIAARAVDPARVLHEDGQIGGGGAGGLALAHAGDAENEQQIRSGSPDSAETQADANRIGLGFALAMRAAVRPIDIGVERAGDMSAQIAVAG